MIQMGKSVMDKGIVASSLESSIEGFSSLSNYGINIEYFGFLTQINIRTTPANKSLVEETLEISFPTKINTYKTKNDLSLLCLGPDEWLFVAPLEWREKICSDCVSIEENKSVSFVDVSFNRIVLRMSGKNILELFSGLTSFPTNKMDFGICSNTLLAKSQVIIQCIQKRNIFNVFVRSSFSDYLSDVIIDQSRWIASKHD